MNELLNQALTRGLVKRLQLAPQLQDTSRATQNTVSTTWLFPASLTPYLRLRGLKRRTVELPLARERLVEQYLETSPTQI